MIFNEKSQKYSAPFIQGPTQKWMLNVDSQMFLLTIGDFVFPVTVNNQEYSSSYVCSPYNALVTYGQDELFKIKNPFLRLCLNGLMKMMGGFLKAVHINQNVCINNFYLSTNPYPD